jgi:hypothetical protein
MVKKTAAISLGCPSGVFGWMKGGILAILAQDAAAVKEVISSVASAKNIPSTYYEILGNLPTTDWFIVSCGLFPFHPPASKISKVLATDVILLFYDDTSGALGYDYFRRGILIENLEICEAFPDCSYEMIFGRKPGRIAKKSTNHFLLNFVDTNDGDTFITFESTLISCTEDQVRKGKGFINERFKKLGIQLPSKHSPQD